MANHKNHYSVLHIAVAYYSDDPTYSELLEIVLDHYHKPEYLDAKASNNAKSTPLQIAIAIHNQVAVGGFIKAGASIKRGIYTTGHLWTWPSTYLRSSPTRELTPITAKNH